MLTSILNAVGSLLGAVVDLVGGLLGSLTGAIAPVPAITTTLVTDAPSANDTDPAATPSPVQTAIDGISNESSSLLDSAIDGTDQLIETGIVDSAHALGELAQDLAGYTITTTTTSYYPDGTLASVVEEVSHAPGAMVMMHYVSEVLAPQVNGIGAGVEQFMQQTGAGVEQALGNITAYDLSYSTYFGTSLLVIDRI